MCRKYFCRFLLVIVLLFLIFSKQIFAGGQIPSQLFDIALVVDKTEVNNVSELKARVTFINFGNVDIPVQMTFVIIDKNKKEYYRSIDKTTIQTEGVFNKTFEGLLLEEGKYTLVLNTLYNTNIKDEFKYDFEVGNFGQNKSWMLIVSSGIILILIFSIILLVIRRKTKVKRGSKK